MSLPDKKVNIEISTNTIIKVLIVLFLLWILYLIQEVVAIVFFSIILVSILEPSFAWLRRKKVPKIVAILLLISIVIALIALIVILLVPPIIDQANQISESFPAFWQTITTEFSNLRIFLDNYGISEKIQSSLENFEWKLPQASGGLFSKVSNFFSGIVSIFIVFIITFYLLVEENAIKKVLKSIVPSSSLPYAYQMVNRVQTKLGLWLRGQLILGFIIFAAVYIGLSILGVEYALILAIIAGLLEFIPYLGPLISGFIAVTLTLFHSPIQALLVLILYLVIQAAENHIFVPMVMKKAIGLNPVISIIALLIGGKLAGIVGVILAIPVVTAISVFAEDFFEKKRDEEMRLEED